MNSHYFQKIIQRVSYGFAICATILLLGSMAYLASAQQTTVPVTGFLWSDMPDQSDQLKTCTDNDCGRGLGWISMNSSSDGSAIPYGVTLNTATGDLSGYAWSEHGGWVNFDATGFPLASGTAATSAKIMPSCYTDSTQSSCPVIGWVRFFVGMQPLTNAWGGWDGWVSLNTNTTPQYGVTYTKSTGKFAGYAWGDMVSGWIDFSKAQTVPQVPQLTCQGQGQFAGITYTYTPGNYPSQCDGIVPIDDYAPVNAIDLCTNLTGNQFVLPTFINGTWYYDPAPTDNYCVRMPNSLIGCTNPLAPNYNAQYLIDTVPSSCDPIPGGGNGSTNPVDPIYKEN